MKSLYLIRTILTIVAFFILLSSQSFAQLTFHKDLVFNNGQSSEKFDSNLSQIESNFRKYPQQKSIFDNNSHSLYNIKEDKVLLELYSNDGASQFTEDLKKIGFQQEEKYGKMITGWLRIANLEKLEELENLVIVRPSYKPITHIGVTTSQGDSAQYSSLARYTDEIDGEGSKIGVLSDSYNTLGGENSGILSGDLPGPANPNGYNTSVQVIREHSVTASDEGRGMIEIVHDVAPGAELAFHTAFGGQSIFANGILALAAAGCDIIVDDVSYLAEPFFQDGIIAQAVNTVKAAGVSYFSSAGNMGDNSYENSFNDTGSTITVNGIVERLHDFGGGDMRQTIIIPQGRQFLISFQWSNPFFSVSGAPGAGTDLNFYLLPKGTNSIVAAGYTNNLGGDPVEVVNYINNTAGTEFEIMITTKSGAIPSKIKYIIYSSGITIAEHDTQSGTIVGHANAEGAIAVGAAHYFNTKAYNGTVTTTTSYSSIGGVPILFDQDGNSVSAITRQKPEMIGPDGGNTTFFGSDIGFDADAFPNFFGTSAAAPHIAAATALIREAGAKTDSEALQSIYATIQDLNIEGFDYFTGFGEVKIDAAVTFARTTFPVELVYFNAESDDRLIYLRWETATETDNEGFMLQQSIDGTRYEDVDFIHGQGTISYNYTYFHTLRVKQAGTYYFRLIQKDFDGKTTILPTVQVRIEPRPNRIFVFSDQNKQATITVTAGEAANFNLMVYDMMGQLVHSQQGHLLEQEIREINYDGLRASEGLYAYVLYFKGERFIKEEKGKFFLHE